MKKDPVSKHLLDFFERRKLDRKGMSVRTLARLIGASPAFTHHILKGTRRGSLELYEKICEILDIDTEKRDLILGHVMQEKGVVSGKAKALSKGKVTGTPSGRGKKDISWKAVPLKSFHLLESRKSIAVLETIGLLSFNGKLEWVADKLQLPLDTVERVVESLLSAGLVEMDGKKLAKSSLHFDFSSSQSQEEIRAYHKDCLQAALRELNEKTATADREQRLITTTMFAVSKEEIPALKARLNEMLDEIASEFFTDSPDAVYQLGLQAFPVTK